MIGKPIKIFLLLREIAASSPIVDFQNDKFGQEDLSFNVATVL